jgi:hypothetical protein
MRLICLLTKINGIFEISIEIWVDPYTFQSLKRCEIKCSFQPIQIELEILPTNCTFESILDKHGFNENAMLFCRYSVSKWLSFLTILLKFITKRITTFFYIGSPINWLEIFCESNQSLIRPCSLYNLFVC